MDASRISPEIQTELLLVDDRPANLVALQAILEPLGQNLITASSGEEALKLVLQHDFAVILLDVLMPGMDGFETAELIKKRERSRHIPIIFLTAVNTQDQHVFRGYTLGAVDYISKPFDPDILRSKVAVFVELYIKGKKLERQAELLRQSEQRERERELDATRRLGERRYRELAESMPQIVWTAQGDGSLRYCNGRWHELTGLDLDATRERGWPAVFHPDDLARFESAWSAALREHHHFEAEGRLRRASDGSYRWHLLRAVPTTSDDGGTTWIGTATDIDDRRRAEDGLRFLSEASQLLAESLDVRDALRRLSTLAIRELGDWCLIDLVDGENRIDRVAVANADPARVERVHAVDRARPPVLGGTPRGPLRVASTGVTEHIPELTDDDLRELSSGPDQLALLRELDLVSYLALPLVARGRTHGVLTLATAESGRVLGPRDRWLGEELARRAAIALDNAQLYEIAQRERLALEMANRAKDEFLAILSHELRTPLNAIIGWTSLLRSGSLDAATTRRAVETVERNAVAQSQLISDLLDVSRIISGKLRLSLRATRLDTLVEGVVDSISREAEAKHIVVESRIDVLPPLEADPERLQQVVTNLLSNALKFTPAGGRVEVTLRRQGATAVLTVADTGVGIAPEFLPHVFDRFRQADSSTTRHHGGLGLGLSIVRHLMELHGGQVHAESEGHGTGARFVVELPLRRAEDPVPAVAEPVQASDPDALRGVRVLIVEDQADARDLFQRILVEHGAEVTAVSSAAEALEKLPRERPQVLLSDIGLPYEDGYTLIRKVRQLADDQGGRTPAAALTAFALPSDGVDALAAGFQRHVPKPVPPEVLVEVVRTLAGIAEPQAPQAAVPA